MTKIFVLDKEKNIKVICDKIDIESKKYSFKHSAELYIDSVVVAKVEIKYDNRTWECYEFRTALFNIVDTYKFFSDEDKTKYLDVVRGWGY